MRSKSFRFGDWRVDPETNSVSKDVLSRQLEPRAMDVLVFLCQHPNVVVSAEELLLACWGSTLHGDNPVHKILTQVRRALDDSSVEPRYIETIRKRGYRTIAEVEHDQATHGSWLDDSPFRGLEPFQQRHASIFFGRKFATEMLLQTALRQLRAGCAMVLLLGPSGSGKTSLVHAGLLPQLSADPSPGVAVTCHLHFDCADLAQADLFEALGSVLLDSEAGSARVFDDESAASLGRRLAHDMESVLVQLRKHGSDLALCLFIDRLEAIFRFPHLTDATRASFIAALDQLAHSRRIMLVLACRNDFYPHLMAFPALKALKLRGGHFDLTPPGAAEIAQIIRQPVRAAALHFETDDASGVGLDDVLCDAASDSPDTLPLLQYCLHELYRRRSPEGALTFAVFRDLGGIDGAIGARAEQVVAALGKAEIDALPQVLSHLVSLAEDELAVTSRRAAWSLVPPGPGRELVKALVDARLFVSGLAGGVPTFGIAHEAILRRWPRVVAWIDNHRHALQVRARVRLQAARWQANGKARDLLLPPGIQVRQASGLLDMAEFALSPQERDFILVSQRKVKLGERLRLAVSIVVVGLAVLASALGLAARAAQQLAEQHRTEAEGLMAYMLGDFVDKLRPLGRLDLLDSVSARALGYLSAAGKGDATAVALTQRSKALNVIAEVKIARADPGAARVALLAARDILHQQLRAAPDDKDALASLGANAFWLGQIHFDQDDWENAERYMAEYQRISDRVASLAPNDVDAWIEQSYAHNSLGSLAFKRGAIERASAEFATSVALKTRALAQRPGDSALLADLADSLSWLASAEAELGKLDAAMRLYARELALVLPLHEASPKDALWSHRYAFALWHQAELQLVLGHADAASQAMAQASRLLQQIVRQDPSNRSWQMDASNLELKMLEIEAADANPALILAKLKTLERALSGLIQLEPKKPNLLRLVASTKACQARVHLQHGRIGEARASLQPALASLEALRSDARQDGKIRDTLTAGLLLQADIERAAGDAGAAQQACRRAQAMLAPGAAGSRDFHVLAPWVRAHYCTNQAATVFEQQKKLEKMAYREAAYVQAISPPTGTTKGFK